MHLRIRILTAILDNNILVVMIIIIIITIMIIGEPQLVDTKLCLPRVAPRETDAACATGTPPRTSEEDLDAGACAAASSLAALSTAGPHASAQAFKTTLSGLTWFGHAVV